jgi:choline kinase
VEKGRYIILRTVEDIEKLQPDDIAVVVYSYEADEIIDKISATHYYFLVDEREV